MLDKPRAYIRAARSMPIDLLAAKVMRRAGLNLAAVRRAELLADPKAKDPARLARLFDMVNAQVEASGEPAVRLASAQVLEIGCGQLGGLSATAVVAGAERYLGVDPGFEPAVFQHPAVARRFLRPALVATAAHYGSEEGQAELMQRFAERCRFQGGPLHDLDENAADTNLVLSISCLEHIHDLAQSLAHLRRRINTDARQVHLVNFSNHTDKAAPFAGLYETDPDRYRRQFGGHINQLRPPDILDAFKTAGFDARVIPQDVRPELLPTDERMHPWWVDRYDRATLAIRTALVLVN